MQEIYNGNINNLETTDEHSKRMQRTVGENIDAKIYALKQEIERLEASKESLAPLLNIRIGDIQSAMSF